MISCSTFMIWWSGHKRTSWDSYCGQHVLSRDSLFFRSSWHCKTSQCLQALPSLLELEIDRARILKGEGEGHQPILNDELLLWLTPGVRLGEIEQLILLPQLQVIKFGLLDCHNNNLANMINSHWSQPSNPVSCIKSIHLKYHREWERRVICRLERFEAQGLQLSVMNREIIYNKQMSK